jgi:hypothetical protein
VAVNLGRLRQQRFTIKGVETGAAGSGLAG